MGSPDAPRTIEVVSSGARTTVQDLGRPGYAALGVGPSGAADRGALGLANRLVANDAAAPALEVVLGGLHVVAHHDCRVAVCGAPRPVRHGRHAVAMDAPFTMLAGAELVVGHGGPGLYTYVAFDGALAVEPVLGSASTDVLGGIGPAPLAPGDRLDLGPPNVHAAPVDLAPVAPWPDPVVLRVLPGPRVDWFAPDALTRLTTTLWTVAPTGNRVASRLEGPPILRARSGELASEGVVRGAIQIPPDGQPVVFGPDHPTTGGYPVLAVVLDEDLDAAAQAAPGTALRFRSVAGRPT